MENKGIRVSVHHSNSMVATGFSLMSQRGDEASLTVRLYGVSGKGIRLFTENNTISFSELREYTR